MPAQPRGQYLTAHAVVELLQLDPALARPGAVFVLIKTATIFVSTAGSLVPTTPAACVCHQA